jgi:glucan-binding YG repeat protein
LKGRHWRSTPYESHSQNRRSIIPFILGFVLVASLVPLVSTAVAEEQSSAGVVAVSGEEVSAVEGDAGAVGDESSGGGSAAADTSSNATDAVPSSDGTEGDSTGGSDIAPLESTGWVAAGGGWQYYANGSPVKGLVTITITTETGSENRTYYFDSRGYRQTGWHKLSGSWYYFDESTRAQEDGSYMWKGWLNWGGGWFYLNERGVMLRDWQKIEGRWYFFLGGDSGRMESGWLNWGGGWFYLQVDETGRAPMLTGVHKLRWSKGTSLFCFRGGDSGRMLEGWQKGIREGEEEAHWYYFRPGDGDAARGWFYSDNGCFYLDHASPAQMLTGLHRLPWSKGTSLFCFRGGDSGRMLEGWQKAVREGEEEAHWYYFRSGDGDAARGWFKWDNGWFYLDPAKDGEMLTGWQYLSWSYGTSWFCFRGGDSGRMRTGWVDYEGTQRFLDNEGAWRGEEFDQKMREICDKVGYSGDVLFNGFNYVAGLGYRSGNTYPSGHWVPDYAMEMYDRGSGNCYRFAALYCMLALANGYDAQVITGFVPSRSSGWAPHAWVEIYHNGTYYVCDPDLAHEVPGHSWYWVTYSQASVTYRR